MGHIGGKLPAQVLTLNALGDIHQQQNRAGHLSPAQNRVGNQLAEAVLYLQQLGPVSPSQNGINRPPEGLSLIHI